MARGRGREVPAYRLHRRSGQAVVTLDGRDFYLGIHGSPESRPGKCNLRSGPRNWGRSIGRSLSTRRLLAFGPRLGTSCERRDPPPVPDPGSLRGKLYGGDQTQRR
jgi:hypothetical protein